MDNTLINSVSYLISQTLGISRDQITDRFTYGDVPEWDSMGHMNLMLALEEKYGIQVSADTITNLVSIPAILAYLEDNHHD
jgi:acyl carrier protein